MSNYRDGNGNVFQTPDGKPPAFSGVPVVIQTPSGPVQGTWTGGQAVKDK